MPTATTEFRSIRKHAESIKNDDTHTIATMSPGDAWAQGDVLIVSLAAVPRGAIPCKVERQLAPGTTQGSRHCLASLDGVEAFLAKDATPLDGPILRTSGVVEIDHPEHGNVILPAGVYAIVYQRQYADELRRVAD